MTEDDIAQAAAYLGTPLDMSDLGIRYDRLGSIAAVILEVLRERRANLLNGPASFAVSGVYQESNAETIRALGEQIEGLETAAAGASAQTVRRVTLTPRRGR